MEFYITTKISIPLFQILLLLLLSTVALLYGKKRLALLANYVFIMYWCYLYNLDYLQRFSLSKVDFVSISYIGFGLVIVALVIIGFLSPSE
jgi:hypothetical protein